MPLRFRAVHSNDAPKKEKQIDQRARLLCTATGLQLSVAGAAVHAVMSAYFVSEFGRSDLYKRFGKMLLNLLGGDVNQLSCLG